ncbi:ABC transporter substrate-binding protein [Actinotalea sp. K2]|uniref:ABC transporter substrate-binding protein n=1 Tax=Actinotalea sp. K2 TaxID=2939438 RepID=UPI0020171183|nr:ABC transporter substrate-binding protein [Actinotalea sp. K2]MCL3862973.1 ABC transporter substrate-binding protein [Actinotalea sp. K2]
MRQHRTRPLTRVAALTGLAALVLTACAQGGTGTDAPDTTAEADGEATIRFAWWGSDHYHEMYQDVADAFMAENPEVTIISEFTDWGGYWDKLATTVAAGDTPDVLMQEQRYLREYAERGVLADISEHGLEASGFDQALLETGMIDGALYAVPTGVNMFALVANPQVLEQAGLEMPDDTAWSWEEFSELMNAVSASTPDGTYGKQDWGSNDAGLSVFIRQHGEQLYTEEGALGYSDETLEEWWQMALDLQREGGQPPATIGVEIGARGPEQSLVGTSTGAVMAEWTNQLTAIAGASGQDVQLLRWPGESTGERTGMYFKPTLYASMSSTTEHPEVAARFIDFMLNSETAGDIILADLGLPVNLETRERVVPELPEADGRSADFVADLADEVVDSPAVPPVGAGEISAILERINTEVLFERMTPAEAAAQFRAEVEAVIGT